MQEAGRFMIPDARIVTECPLHVTKHRELARRHGNVACALTNRAMIHLQSIEFWGRCARSMGFARPPEHTRSLLVLAIWTMAGHCDVGNVAEWHPRNHGRRGEL